MPYTSPSRTIAPSKRHAISRAVLGVALLVSIALVATLGFYFTDHLPFWRRHIPHQGATASSFTKGEPSIPTSTSSQINATTNSDKGGANSTSGQPTTNTNSTNTPPITGSLTAPWGTFANVYNAKVSDQMQSTCNTTPGATCQILFTNGSVTKSLDAEGTDAGGAVYWAWTPAGVGLTPGTWHITAKAVLGSQTKTTSNDPLTLEIQ